MVKRSLRTEYFTRAGKTQYCQIFGKVYKIYVEQYIICKCWDVFWLSDTQPFVNVNANQLLPVREGGYRQVGSEVETGLSCFN